MRAKNFIVNEGSPVVGVYRTGGMKVVRESEPPCDRQERREIEFVYNSLRALREDVKGPDAVKILDEAISKAASANADCED